MYITKTLLTITTSTTHSLITSTATSYDNATKTVDNFDKVIEPGIFD